jgi:K+-transporting ATPase ATPase C chain
MNIDNNVQNKNNKHSSFHSIVSTNLKTATRIVLIMVMLLGIAYPIFLVVIGQITLPFQSNGSILEQDGKKVGSKLISQTFESPKFFHPRSSNESASAVDPHITPESAYLQIKNVSKATDIPETTLKTLINLNVEQNKVTNGLFFAPFYVNVLEINLELVRQYPQVYGISLSTSNSTPSVEPNGH